MTIIVSTLDGGQAKIEDEELDALRTGIQGDVLVPTDDGYEANPIYNAMHNRRPALKVRATGTADVVDIVNWARERNLLVAVRGGGHSVAGLSSCDGGVVIDLTRMRGVTVDPVTRRASVQGGAIWRDVDRETQAFGLVVPGGVVSETGVGGLTLGGGEGWVRRKYGLTIDSLRSATVVCADGSVHVATVDNDPDLFWALRGGGGNFGVVTNFEFDAHPLGPIVAFAGVFYSTRDAGEILPRWRDHVTDAPDEVTSVAVAISMPADPDLPEALHNQSCLVIGGVYAGDDVDEGMKVLQPLRELGTPLADISEPSPFVGVNSSFDPFFPMGTYQSYWKAQNLDTLPDEVLSVVAAKADSRPSPVTLAVLFQMGGAINRVASDATAYSERTAQWMSSFDGNWEDPNDNAANIAWVRAAFNEVAKYGKGSTYTNFTGQADETTDALARNAYGANSDRLQAIKKQYDPDNFFRINPNILPS